MGLITIVDVTLVTIFFIIKLVGCNIKVLAPTTSSLSQQRSQMLKLINQVRSGLNRNLATLYLDQTLNGLAQNHSIDMIKRNYFNHTSPDGKGPGDRAKIIGFKYAVGQNIAIGSNVSHMHQSLMKSPGHYNNTIRQQWTRCGIGFEKNSKGFIYATIMFSTRNLQAFPVPQLQLDKIQQQISKYIIETNRQLNQQDKVLSDLLKKFYKQKKQGADIWGFLKNEKYSKSGVAYTNTQMKMPWSANLIKQIGAGNMFKQTNQNFRVFGIALRVYNSMVQIMVVYGTK